MGVPADSTCIERKGGGGGGGGGWPLGVGPVKSTCWLHYLECEAIINNLNCSMGLNGSKGI